MHHTAVDLAQTISIFQDASKGTSSNYVIDKDGTIYRLLNDNTVANHVKENSKISNLLQQSIGIEIVNSGALADLYTDSQYESLNKLLNYLEKTNNLQHNDQTIKAHYEVDPPSTTKTRKWDPSPGFSWNKIGLQGHPLLHNIINRDTCESEINFENTGYSCDQVYRVLPAY